MSETIVLKCKSGFFVCVDCGCSHYEKNGRSRCADCYEKLIEREGTNDSR